MPCLAVRQIRANFLILPLQLSQVSHVPPSLPLRVLPRILAQCPADRTFRRVLRLSHCSGARPVVLRPRRSNPLSIQPMLPRIPGLTLSQSRLRRIRFNFARMVQRALPAKCGTKPMVASALARLNVPQTYFGTLQPARRVGVPIGAILPILLVSQGLMAVAWLAVLAQPLNLPPAPGANLGNGLTPFLAAPAHRLDGLAGRRFLHLLPPQQTLGHLKRRVGAGIGKARTVQLAIQPIRRALQLVDPVPRKNVPQRLDAPQVFGHTPRMGAHACPQAFWARRTPPLPRMTTASRFPPH